MRVVGVHRSNKNVRIYAFYPLAGFYDEDTHRESKKPESSMSSQPKLLRAFSVSSSMPSFLDGVSSTS
jgi:hypothetical protein